MPVVALLAFFAFAATPAILIEAQPEPKVAHAQVSPDYPVQVKH